MAASPLVTSQACAPTQEVACPRERQNDDVSQSGTAD